MVKKPYPPGQKGKRRTGSVSEYGKELQEKQRLKNWYNLRERKFKNYVKEALRARGKVEDTGDLLIKRLETLLDNVVFRMGFASSRSAARQMVSHGHIMVNGKKVNVSSYHVKTKDIVSINPKSASKTIFQDLRNKLNKYNPPSWIKIDADKLEGTVIGEPSLEEANPPAELSAIFEFYSR